METKDGIQTFYARTREAWRTWLGENGQSETSVWLIIYHKKSKTPSVHFHEAHPDHVGGVLGDKGNPVFSQAVYYICRTEWDFWFSEQAIQPGGWMTEFAREKLTPIKD